MGKAYCTRCAKRFPSQQALQQHYDDSPRHYRCDICGFDGSTWEKFLQHNRKTKHRVVCQGCDDGEGIAWIAGSQEYLVHLKEQNVCQACEEHFDSSSNLHHHQMVHLPRSIECYGCYRKFSTLPAMIIHLESGACPSGIDIVDLNESAAMCFQWKAYLHEDYQNELLNRVDLLSKYGNSVYPFKCPECDTRVTKLSGLLQHVYSDACNQSLYEGKIAKLTKWLEKRYSVDEE
ncbi:uncharacterized protein EI97DRAFT_419793 [Westerdykella ornata]|uniref:C2H2-type domain-containing protein n=1 Tax=Westerdykella ornata TaxID=318751 RepID=A0A6A6JHZ6_WESOR|nr:uncharacterized protein EI97DRAFT_419793 [Westerdykella ornata]KAF2276017.1 hypothetical protein EI97DRAFT_419793 [Westerdykella ornata]